ncbi:MAG: SOS response-associated peptidase [Hyphomicrobiaceae bacterium]
MTSRYCLTSPPEAVSTCFGCPPPDRLAPRYNIAPTQPVAIARHNHARQPELTLVRWGLIPSWVRDPARLGTLFSARAETAAEKPSFRGAFRHRRCLVPANGYYEWTGKSGARRPFLVRPRAGGLLAFAGLWDHWLGADGSEVETMAILTVPANATLCRMNERMPAIMNPSGFEAWLDTRAGTSVGMDALLHPAPDDALEAVEVGPRLNNPRDESPEIAEMIRPMLN